MSQIAATTYLFSQKTRIVVAALVAIVTYGVLLFIPFDCLHPNIIFDRIADAGHLPLFAVITWSALAILHRVEKKFTISHRTLFLFILLAILLTEFIQSFVGRSASLADTLFGALGAGLAIFNYNLLITKRASRAQLLKGLLLTLFVACIPLFPIAHAIQVYQHGKKMFPVIGNFENRLELKLWHPYAFGTAAPVSAQINNDKKSAGQFALSLILPKADYAGVSYYWQQYTSEKYSSLLIDIYNPAHKFVVHVRLDDKTAPDYDDRYTEQFIITPGWHTIVVPLDRLFTPNGRRLSSDKLRKLLIFLDAASLPHALFIDNIRLE